MDPTPLETNEPRAGGEGKREAVSRRAKRGFVWSQIGGVLDYGFYLVFAVLVARAIGVQEFGLYGTIISYASLGLILAGLGLERATIVHAAPLAENNPSMMRCLMRRFVAVRLGAGVFVATVLFVLAGPLMSYLSQPRVGYLLGWMGFYIVSMGLTALFMAYFSARMDLRNPKIAKASMQLVNVAGAAWIYKNGGSAGVVLFLLSATSVLTMLAIGWMSRGIFSGQEEKVDFVPVRSFCKSQTAMEFITFVTGKNADIILLNLMLAGTIQVGFYNVSSALVLAISTMFVAGVGDIALSATSVMVNKGEPDQLRRAWRFSVKSGVLLTVPYMVFAFGIAPAIVGTLLDRTYLPAAEVFRIAVMGQIMVSLLGGGSNANILLSSDRHEELRNIRVVMGLVNIALNLMLIPRWGAAGAAGATAIAAVGRVFWEYREVGKLQRFPLPGRTIISMTAASIVATLVVVWFPFNRWAYLLTTGLGFTAVFVFLAWILKPYDEEDAPVIRRAGYPFDGLARYVCRDS
jgi:O-antigen/teichoic acid export membrane protein